ncbi:RNA polymerase sigma70 [Bacillus amyloliquefaciens EBL11]|nr:RNA polymerase sigma70 [Bacillus amyloliquefaciens EBL11]
MDYQVLLRSKCKEIMKHPIVKHFLSDPKHYEKFKNVLEHSDEKDAKSLDDHFKQFYKEIRIIKYMNSMIRIFSIDFDKRIRKNQKRYPLTVDQPEGGEALPYEMGKDAYEEFLRKQGDLSQHVQNRDLYEALQTLTDKQKSVLTNIYLHGATMKEIAESLGESRQNISNIHKKGLDNLRKQLDKKKKGENKQ